jgi:hypothetical protein
MPKYLVLYKSSVPALQQMGSDPEAAQAGMELWMNWAGRVGGAMTDMGSPLSPVASVDATGATARRAVSEVCGFSVLESDSVEGVKRLLDDHPHFRAPGDSSIEVLEFLPIPGM